MKSELRELSRTMTAVHKVLLDETLRQYAQREGRPLSPQDAWRAAMNDPFFSWLRPVSLLIAEIDEMLTRVEEIDTGLAHGVRLEVESLLSGITAGPDFARRYRDMLQESPDLAARHGAMKAVLARLRAPDDAAKIVTRDQWPLPDRGSEETVH